MEYPKILYVTEEPVYDYYNFPEIKHLVGSEFLDSRVSDNGREHVVGVYHLVAVEKYRKITTRTSTVEKIND